MKKIELISNVLSTASGQGYEIKNLVITDKRELEIRGAFELWYKDIQKGDLKFGVSHDSIHIWDTIPDPTPGVCSHIIRYKPIHNIKKLSSLLDELVNEIL